MSCSTCNIAQHVAALHCADTEATAVSSACARHSAVDPHPHPHPHSHSLPRICSVASCRSASNIIIADAALMTDAMLPSFSPACAHVAGKLLAPPSLSTPRSAATSAVLPVSLSSPSVSAASVATPCLFTSPSAPLLDREPTVSTSLPEFPLPFAELPPPSILPPPPQSPRTTPPQAPHPPPQSPVNLEQQAGKSGKSAKSWTAAVTMGVGSSLGVAAIVGVRFAGYGAQPSLLDLFSSLGVPLDIRMIEACALSLWHLSSALSFPISLSLPSLSPSLDRPFNLLLLLLLTALCAAGVSVLLPPSTSAAGAASRGRRRSERSATSGVGFSGSIGGGMSDDVELRGDASTAAEARVLAETIEQSGPAAEFDVARMTVGDATTPSAPAGAAGTSEGGWWWGSGWWWRVSVDASVGGGSGSDGATDVLREGLGAGTAAAAAGGMTKKISNLSVEVPETTFLSASHQPSPSSASPRVSSPFPRFTASSPTCTSSAAAAERLHLLHRAADAAAAASAALLSPRATCPATDAATGAATVGAVPADADGSAAAAAAAAAAAEAFMESDRGEVNSGDLADLMLHLDWSYDEGLGRWDRIIDKESDDVQYEAWRRDPKNGGPTEYHTLTRFLGLPAQLVAAYYTDCSYHLQHQCDPVLKAFSPLSACPVTGVHKGRFERKYPLCAAREYVLAWKVWEMWGGGPAGREEEGGVRGVEGGEVVFCVTKAVEDASVPRKSKPKRVDIYNCGWRVQDVVLPDGRKAAEIEMVVRDDCGIQRDMAKMAFRRGAWGYVCNTLAHIRGYAQLHPHLLLPPPPPPHPTGVEVVQGEKSVQAQQEQGGEERAEEMEGVQQPVLSSQHGSSRVFDQDGILPAGDAAAAGVAAQAEVSTLAALSASASGAAMGLGVGGLLVVHCGAAGAASKVLLACTLRSMWVGAQRESPQEGPSQAGCKEARK
ncbi:unnamed protein product [Closterium sp. Yama58-4]|nr:unnamed protein product [Closterium sp. Yama58-4]